MTDLWALEYEIQAEGYPIICGVDEAGRGPLAGPVVAAAVLLPPGLVIDGVNDSKKLTEAKRKALFATITDEALAYGIGIASEEEIDAHNILNATYLAMNRALEELNTPFDLALIDGNRASGISFPNRPVVQGDAKCMSIAAASILAKVARDEIMLQLHAMHPQYGFDRHKGYPTKAHYQALDLHGVSEVHRVSFLRKWAERT